MINDALTTLFSFASLSISLKIIVETCSFLLFVRPLWNAGVHIEPPPKLNSLIKYIEVVCGLELYRYLTSRSRRQMANTCLFSMNIKDKLRLCSLGLYANAYSIQSVECQNQLSLDENRQKLSQSLYLSLLKGIHCNLQYP